MTHNARRAFRLAYGLVRADRAAGVAGFGTTTQAWAALAFARALDAATLDDDLDRFEIALDAALRVTRADTAA